MTRTELQKIASEAWYNKNYSERLYHCSAWTKETYRSDTGEAVRILRSYATNVAIETFYNGNTILYVLGSWSATTWQHINKYIDKYNPDIVVYLTDRSDNLIEWDRVAKAITYSTKSERQTAHRTDYENRIYEI